MDYTEAEIELLESKGFDIFQSNRAVFDTLWLIKGVDGMISVASGSTPYDKKFESVDGALKEMKF